MKKAIGYVRVSTQGQAQEGVSIDAQADKIKAWAAAMEYDLVAVYTDAGLSGGRADNRPALQEALTAAGEGMALVVYSLSRLARSTKDAIDISERIEAQGADLVSLSERIDTTTASGKMVFRMLAVLAEFERDQISERTKTALAFKKSQGKRVGTVPFGYDLDVDGETLTCNAVEQAAIQTMDDLRANGYTLREVAGELDARGINTKKGGSWTPKVIATLIKKQERQAA